jgi:predicted AAA+ superfamily ATPase
VLIDEWQEVPQILGAVKRTVDDDPRPGRFLLTGSVEAELTRAMWPGTGRVVRVVMRGLTRREIDATVDAPGVLSIARSGSLDAIRVPDDAPDLDGYLELACVSGFPEPALRLLPQERTHWLDSYVDHVVSRDASVVGHVRDPLRLRRYLEVLALSTAGQPTDATLTQAADLDRRAAASFDHLLANLYLLDLVPAWSTNRLARLVKRVKRYVADPALALAAARIGQTAVLGDPDMLGRLLDTFVAAQLRPEIDLIRPRARLHHLRTEGGRHEVDLVVDLGGGEVIAIEIKAGSAPTSRDVRHLAWLRDELGEKFVRGILFHTGRLPFEIGERIWALPIATLWA